MLAYGLLRQLLISEFTQGKTEFRPRGVALGEKGASFGAGGGGTTPGVLSVEALECSKAPSALAIHKIVGKESITKGAKISLIGGGEQLEHLRRAKIFRVNMSKAMELTCKMRTAQNIRIAVKMPTFSP
jgi:hypothetical protein